MLNNMHCFLAVSRLQAGILDFEYDSRVKFNQIIDFMTKLDYVYS